MNGTGLVRQPSSRLAEGIDTHITRSSVDVSLARAQHAAYVEALGASGWAIEQAPAAEDCPDSVFIEDTVVICEDLAVLTRPGTPARRPEVAGVAQAVSELGLRTATIEETRDPGGRRRAAGRPHGLRGARRTDQRRRHPPAALAAGAAGPHGDRRPAGRRPAPEVRGDRAAGWHVPAAARAGSSRAVPGGAPRSTKKAAVTSCRSAATA